MKPSGTPGRSGGGAADAGVAASKFVVPRRRADVVRRPRLNGFIDAAVGGKGVLLAAPAGYGKTTLVVDWLQTSDFAAVWLSLDAWDAELPAFALALAGAVRARFDRDVVLGDERFWQPRTVGTVIVNAIAERKPLRAVFRDSGFAKDADRTNAEQIFAERSPATDVKTI